ncbi:MAG: hypothetical protein ACMUEM_07470 [Flavobacteriales bacterium AspAUS03]
MKTILKESKIASFIFDPLVQGTAGIVIYPTEALSTLIECMKIIQYLHYN